MTLHSHAKAMICMSLLNSSTSMGTSLSRIRKISKTELSVFFDLECLSTWLGYRARVRVRVRVRVDDRVRVGDRVRVRVRGEG